MANTLTPQDAYAFINDVAQQMQGRKALTATDPSTFVAVGEELMTYGYENVMNAISTKLMKVIIATRPYKSKLKLMDFDNDLWGAITNKVTFLPLDAEQDSHMNTNLNATCLDDGNSIDMYGIRKPKPVEFHFIGTKVYQNHITRFEDQLSQAFTSPQAFIQFINGYMVELSNDIEQWYEVQKRATLLNFIGGLNDLGTYVVDLVAEFNDYMGNPSPALTRADCFSPTYIEKFFENNLRVISDIQDKMTERSALYHYSPTNLPTEILRHTPKEKQRFMVYGPFFKFMETMVNPNLFHEISMETTEQVSYWQSITSPSEVKVTPNEMDLTTGNSVNGTAQSIDYVVGLLYDIDALGVNRQLDAVGATPLNVRGRYTNTWYTCRFLGLNDYSENAVLFVLGA